jgi:hypothetical protein
MALFLIKETDATHWDLAKDIRACYKRGDIVEVYDDDKHDGDIVANPIAAPFYLIRVTNIALAQVLKFADSERNELGETTRRRQYFVRLDDLPQQIQGPLFANRYVEVTANQIRNYVRDKVTGQDGLT